MAWPDREAEKSAVLEGGEVRTVVVVVPITTPGLVIKRRTLEGRRLI